MIVEEVVRDEAQVALYGKQGAVDVFSNIHPLYHVDWFPGMRAGENEAWYGGVYVNVKDGRLIVGSTAFTAKDPIAVFNAILSVIPRN